MDSKEIQYPNEILVKELELSSQNQNKYKSKISSIKKYYDDSLFKNFTENTSDSILSILNFIYPDQNISFINKNESLLIYHWNLDSLNNEFRLEVSLNYTKNDHDKEKEFFNHLKIAQKIKKIIGLSDFYYKYVKVKSKNLKYFYYTILFTRKAQYLEEIIPIYPKIMPLTDIQTLVGQILLEIMHMHSIGIIHLNINRSNIISYKEKWTFAPLYNSKTSDQFKETNIFDPFKVDIYDFGLFLLNLIINNPNLSIHEKLNQIDILIDFNLKSNQISLISNPGQNEYILSCLLDPRPENRPNIFELLKIINFPLGITVPRKKLASSFINEVTRIYERGIGPKNASKLLYIGQAKGKIPHGKGKLTLAYKYIGKCKNEGIYINNEGNLILEGKFYSNKLIAGYNWKEIEKISVNGNLNFIKGCWVNIVENGYNAINILVGEMKKLICDYSQILFFETEVILFKTANKIKWILKNSVFFKKIIPTQIKLKIKESRHYYWIELISLEKENSNIIVDKCLIVLQRQNAMDQQTEYVLSKLLRFFAKKLSLVYTEFELASNKLAHSLASFLPLDCTIFIFSDQHYPENNLVKRPICDPNNISQFSIETKEVIVIQSQKISKKLNNTLNNGILKDSLFINGKFINEFQIKDLTQNNSLKQLRSLTVLGQSDFNHMFFKEIENWCFNSNLQRINLTAIQSTFIAKFISNINLFKNLKIFILKELKINQNIICKLNQDNIFIEELHLIKIEGFANIVDEIIDLIENCHLKNFLLLHIAKISDNSSIDKILNTKRKFLIMEIDN